MDCEFKKKMNFLQNAFKRPFLTVQKLLLHSPPPPPLSPRPYLSLSPPPFKKEIDFLSFWGGGVKTLKHNLS